MRKILPIALLAVVMLACSCRHNGREVSRDCESVLSDTLRDCIPELPLPKVPMSLTAPEERAEYIIAHFWDGLDFGDTLRCRDRAFMEQNFANYLSIFPHARQETLPPNIARLLERASADSLCLNLVNELAEHYLDDPNSPMRNEEYYTLFLEGLLRLPGLSEDERVRPAYLLETARKNRQGTVASDFSYTTRDGIRTSLHSTPGEQILLVFYDPACPHCSEILDRLHKSSTINHYIGNNGLSVLAVYTEGDRNLWNDTKAFMPKEWTVAIDESRIADRGLYALPAMPVIYLLDSDKKVLLKDALLQEIEDELISKTNCKTQ